MSVSGQKPPGAVRGWTQVLVDDFSVDCPRGKFVGNPAYTPRWTAYPSGWPTSRPWKAGVYDNSILEVKNSCLILNVHTDAAGHALVAAPRPKLSPRSPYGAMSIRRSVRFKAEVLPGYKMAWLLWPDSGDWPKDGEIDFPENGLDSGNKIGGFVHKQGAVKGSDQYHAASLVLPTDGEWHTATINYKSGTWRTPLVEFILDGTRIGKWTERVPNGPMHEVIQTEPLLQWQHPARDVAGQIMIDWYSGYKAA